MITNEDRQAIIDEAHLALLPLGYWVSAGFWGAYSLFMVAYFVLIGIVFTSIPSEGVNGPPPAIGWVFLGLGAGSFVVLAAITALRVMAGFWIRRRRHRVGIMIAAALSCLEFPYGTLLGVLTFIALARPSVRALFDDAQRDPAPAPIGDGSGFE